jgi:hypothetical protein
MLKSISSIVNAIGALNYQGTWNANTNSPTIVSSQGVKGDYYVVSVDGATNINGISNWGVGDWITYNGTVWQRVEGGANLNGVDLSASGNTTLNTLNTAGLVVFNDAGADVDFRVEGDTNANLLFVDASADAVGFGTNTPSDRLSVEGGSLTVRSGSSSAASTSNGFAITYNTNAGEANLQARSTGGNTDLLFSTASAGSNAERMRVNSAGSLILVGSTAQKATGTTWSNPSDKRLKDNICDYEKGLAELMQIRVKEWQYNGKGGTVEGTKGLGVIADEIMVVLPDTVQNYDAKLNADDKEVTPIKKFDATEITWLLVKAVQQQQSQIETLKAEVAALKGV